MDGTPLVDIAVSAGSEQGLLGLAFAPDYATSGVYYVSYTDPGGTSRIVEYPSQVELISVSQPQANHNGGWIGFGPDGYLYVALGDGGGSDDNDFGHTAGVGNAQDTSNPLGAILRVDPDTGAYTHHAYGLRNPWRPSFDRMTGDLYIADVGQGACEEIDVQPAGVAGVNYGWRLREGTIATPSGGVGGPHPPGAVDPIFDYPHSAGNCSDPPPGFTGISVTGGYVYRGPSVDLWGRYLFADFSTAALWSLVWDGGDGYVELTEHATAADIDLVSSFGEDSAGNVYVTDLADGEVYRILPEPRWALLGAVLLVEALRRRHHRKSESTARTIPRVG